MSRSFEALPVNVTSPAAALTNEGLSTRQAHRECADDGEAQAPKARSNAPAPAPEDLVSGAGAFTGPFTGQRA